MTAHLLWLGFDRLKFTLVCVCAEITPFFCVALGFTFSCAAKKVKPRRHRAWLAREKIILLLNLMQAVSIRSDTREADGVVVQRDSVFGRVAIATRSFQTGEVVLCERPMLSVASAAARLEASERIDSAASRSIAEAFIDLCRSCCLPMSHFDSLYSIAVDADASSEDVQRIEGDLCTPRVVFTRAERQAAALLLNQEGDFFKRCFPSTCCSLSFWLSLSSSGKTGVQRLLSLVHACRINLHECDGRPFVFAVASKFAHSCDANTFWVLEKTAECPAVVVRHIAVRPIAAGEFLTFSYLGAGLNMLLPTVQRRASLGELHFTCRCSRCAAFDEGLETSRSLTCLECNHKALRMSTQHGAWRCDSCEAVCWKEDEMRGVLFDEQVMVTIVMKLFFSVASLEDVPARWSAVSKSRVGHTIGAISQPLQQRWEATVACRAVLGELHYLVAVAVSGLMNGVLRAVQDKSHDVTEWLLLQRAKDTIDDPNGVWPVVLIQLLESADRWYHANMPLGYQHLKFARTSLCATDLLARHGDVTPSESETLRSFSRNGCLSACAQRLQLLSDYQDFGV